ncbi:heme biosynthesis HemY N-terminal domain-containing protein [Mesorhizobium sp. CAU 1741]|uniref:heme biosynthesis protein HemY n=1 Tax=Mesorhizobium sp. CAU 1741 TaxID=3140366 RepID=UPI00325AA5E6
MLRILFFIGLVFLVGLGFAWLADRPGDMVITFGGYQYQVTLMVAAVVVAAIVVAVMVTWWLLKSIWYSPYTISRYFRVRRRDRGYQALSSGMIAAGAGDAGLARAKKKEAMKLISADQEPLIHLLDAQASLLEGDHDAARRKFEAMLDDPETRLLGLRGLYLEAERLGDRTAARHYAARAAEKAPQLGWAADATLEEKTEAGEWDEALRLVDAQKSTHQIEKDAASRRKAVLLTAKAIEVLESDPAAARAAALEANRVAPDLVPAATVAAKALLRIGDTRKAAKILEAMWKKQPHPEVADVYIHARPGDSTHDRLERAKKLQSLKLNHVESAMAVARAAFEANELAIARREAESAIRLEPREGAYLLLADIEEAETGDQGKIRQYLGKAVRAPRDPAWVADNYVAEKWAPISPVTGRLDAFEWRAPTERLGQLVEFEERQPSPSMMAALPAATLAAAPQPVEEAEPAEPEPPVIDEVQSLPETAAPPAAPTPPASTITVERPAEAASTDSKPQPAPAAPAGQTPLAEKEETVVPPPLPDDPGVNDDDNENAPGESRRFRLF